MLKLLLVVLLLAVATYVTIRAIERRGVIPAQRSQPGGPATRPRARPVAPDDDEDFLRDLDRDRKRRHPEDPEA